MKATLALQSEKLFVAVIDTAIITCIFSLYGRSIRIQYCIYSTNLTYPSTSDPIPNDVRASQYSAYYPQRLNTPTLRLQVLLPLPRCRLQEISPFSLLRITLHRSAESHRLGPSVS